LKWVKLGLITLLILPSLYPILSAFIIPIPEPFDVVNVTPFNHGFLIAGYRVNSVLGVTFLNNNVNLTANLNVSIFYTNLSSYQLLFTQNISNIFLVNNSPLITIQLDGNELLIHWVSLFNTSNTLYENSYVTVYSISDNGVRQIYSTNLTLFSTQIVYPSQIFQLLPYFILHAVVTASIFQKFGIYFIEITALSSVKEYTTIINNTKVAVEMPIIGEELLYSLNGEYNLRLMNTTVTEVIPQRLVNNTLCVAEIGLEQLVIGNMTMQQSKASNVIQVDNITYVAIGNGKVSFINSTILYHPYLIFNNVFYMITPTKTVNVYNYNTTFEIVNNSLKILSQYVITPKGVVRLPIFPATIVVGGNYGYFLGYQNGTYYLETEGGQILLTTHNKIYVIGNLGFANYIEVSFNNGTNEIIYNNGSTVSYFYHFTASSGNAQVLNTSYALLPLGNTSYLVFNQSGLPYGLFIAKGGYTLFYNNIAYTFNETIYGLNISQLPLIPVKVVVPEYSLRVILLSTNGVPIQGLVFINGEEFKVGLNGLSLTASGSLKITAEANGYLPNTTTLFVNSNGSLVIYLKPVSFNVTVNGSRVNVTQIAQGIYSFNATQGEEISISLRVSNYTAYLNGSEVSELTFNFTKPGVYNLTIVYNDPEMTFLIHVNKAETITTAMSTNTTLVTTSYNTSTTTSTSTTNSSPSTTTTSTTTSFTPTTGTQGSVVVPPPVVTTTSTPNLLPLAVIIVILLVSIVVALIIIRRK
jgi:Predicted solute binding protein